MIRELKVLFLLLLCFPAVAAADSQEVPAVAGSGLDQARSSLREINAEFENNLKRYLSLNISDADYKLSPSEKMKKGDFFFGKGDYSTSAGIFYSVTVSVSDSDAVKYEALYKLGESLFMQKNYVSATRYYEMLLTSHGNAGLKAKALKRLIFMSYSLGEYAAAEKYYDQFVQGGNDIYADQELLYYFAKSLFFAGKTDEAVKLFSSVNKESVYYPQARYFLGVMALRDKKLEDSRVFYEEILSLPEDGGYHNFKNIRELAGLAVARIAFDLDDQETASTYYLPTAFDSRSFPQAYYELSWTFIKRDQFENAVDTLRLVKNVAPNSRVATQAEILEGTLLVKMGRFGEALVLFNSIVSKYSKYQDELFSIDGKAFLASGKAGKVSDFLLPYSPAVRSVLEDSKKFSETVALNDTIIGLEEELKRIEDLEKKIVTMAGNKNSAAIFPPLKEAVRGVMTLRNKVAVVKNSLVMARNGFAGTGLSEEQRGEFEKLDSEKRRLLEIDNTASVAHERIRERAEEYGDKVVKLDERMHLVSMQLNSLAENLDLLIASYSEEKSDGKEKENDKEILDRIGQERERFNALSAESDACQAEIDDEKNGLVLGGTLVEAENEIRDSFNGIVARQQGIIGTSSDRREAPEVADLIEEADRIDAKLADFYDRLNDSMKGIVSDLKVSYEQEKSNVESYKSELLRAKREVEEMAVLAIYSNMNTARNIFADLVLQGDLGLIDVAWEKKEESTSEIMRLKTKKATEIQQLQFNLDGEQ
ncbi:tetratricopeptide repeat protein [bacterium]|nr:tetratricopeptide repeat protein [bacterium]